MRANIGDGRKVIRSTTKRARRHANPHRADAAPLDPAALLSVVRELEEKLEAVTQREIEYRESMAHLEAEVRAAGALQRAFLPINPPEMCGARTHVLFRPCSDVSGDLYDIFRIDDEHIGVALADATGHGVPAALLSTMVRRKLREVPAASGGPDGLNPALVLAGVNEELLELGLDDCLFVAGLLAVYNERTGMVRVARGGTPYPVILKEGTGPQAIISEGPVLGAVANPTLEVAEFVLQPGERLLLYTDGVEPLIGAESDAESVQRGWAQVVAEWRDQGAVRNASISSEWALDCLERRLLNSGPQSDDVTVVALVRHDSSAC